MMHQILDFIRDHAMWAGPIMGLLAFAESLAFVGLFFPTTPLLLAVGGLIQQGTLDFWPIALCSIPGAAAGDAVSYWAGRVLGDRLSQMWPFRTRPHLLAKGELFFIKHGAVSIALCRFLGPLRAIVPLTAGMLHMPHRTFQIANVLSAIVWVPLMLVPGAVTMWVIEISRKSDKPLARLVLVSVLVVAACAAFVYFRRRRGGEKVDAAADAAATIAELEAYREKKRAQGGGR
jgi:membrane protein DedA with SNARE-associated domain